MKKGYDFYSKYVNAFSELLLDLQEREVDTKRIDVCANKIRFVSIAKALEKYKTVEALSAKIGIDIELLSDTNDHTKMIACVEGVPYLLGRSSWISISGRIDIYGGGLAALEPDDKAQLINARLAQLGDNLIKVVIVNQKIRAMMSRKYATIPANEVFKQVAEKARERFASTKFVTGFYNHEFAFAQLMFPEVAQKLSEAYGLPEELTPGITVITSDTGHAGVKIVGSWVSPKGRFQQAGTEVYLRHENSNSLEKVLEELPNLFIKYQNMALKLAALMGIEIKFPATVLKKALKELGAGERNAKMLLETLPTNDVTAYDICMELFSLPARLDIAETSRLELEEKIAKAINLDFTKLDNDK